jgi:hypothetical protein
MVCLFPARSFCMSSVNSVLDLVSDIQKLRAGKSHTTGNRGQKDFPKALGYFFSAAIHLGRLYEKLVLQFCRFVSRISNITVIGLEESLFQLRLAGGRVPVHSKSNSKAVQGSHPRNATRERTCDVSQNFDAIIRTFRPKTLIAQRHHQKPSRIQVTFTASIYDLLYGT